MKKVYQVVVEQDVIRKCVIVVGAEDEDEACEKAEDLASDLPFEEWTMTVKFTNSTPEEMDEKDLEEDKENLFDGDEEEDPEEDEDRAE